MNFPTTECFQACTSHSSSIGYSLTMHISNRYSWKYLWGSNRSDLFSFQSITKTKTKQNKTTAAATTTTTTKQTKKPPTNRTTQFWTHLNFPKCCRHLCQSVSKPQRTPFANLTLGPNASSNAMQVGPWRLRLYGHVHLSPKTAPYGLSVCSSCPCKCRYHNRQ